MLNFLPFTAAKCFQRLVPAFTLLLSLTIAAGTTAELMAADRLQVTGQTMGTYFAVTIDGPAESDTEVGIKSEVEARLDTINAQMSTWDESSEISQFNQSPTTDWFPISAAFAGVVQEAKRVHELTEGAFDPTVSPLIDLWGFGQPEQSGVPDQAAIEQALQSVGMQHIDVRPDPPALRRRLPGVQLNLSAIAKGYAVDAIAEMLAKTGRPSFIVDIGGETRAGQAKSSGEPWRVGVESPKTGLRRSQPPQQIVAVTESSIATSGDYRNFFEVDGVTYSHTIDPVTGRPLKNPPASVSVIHESCMTADALATALMVLGPERGLALAEQQQLSVLYQIVDADGQIQPQGTGQFRTTETAGTATEGAQARGAGTWIMFAAAGVLFLIAVGGMAIGVLVSNREIKGSCGGLASMPGSDGKSICELCSIPRDECVNEQLRKQMAESACESESDCSETDCSDASRTAQPTVPE